MSTIRRLRAVFQLAIVSAFCWGLAAVVLTLIAELAFNGGIGHWAPIRTFLTAGFLGLLAGAGFAVSLGLRRSTKEAPTLSAGRATTLGGLGAIAVLLVLRVFGPGEFEGMAMSTLANIAAVFAGVGALTGLGIQRVANRGALPADTSSRESIGP